MKDLAFESIAALEYGIRITPRDQVEINNINEPILEDFC